MEGNEPTVVWESFADLAIVGAGVAGLTAAIEASARGLTVVTVAKGGPSETSTQYAQGGIAIPDEGSAESHVTDTLAAGGGLCDETAVGSIVSGGPAALADLESIGGAFDRAADGRLARTREGGHSTRRIVHAGGDATGAEVQRVLTSAGGGSVVTGKVVEVLITRGEVAGVLVSSERGYGVVHAPSVLLATGGLGQLYSCSTNPPGATGDGVALALGAGAVVADLEFVQFHPTVLFSAGAHGRRPLVSEAVRGEGAHLVDCDGVRFMPAVHPLGDLAPRDVVSRAIAERMHLTGTDHVLLDARSIRSFHARFPTVTASCLDAGIDPLDQPIPVAPAAHYSCGGVVTDVWGRTAVPGLLAAGEVARTGLHGANRLASNSLLEGVVVGKRAGAIASERAGRVIPVRSVARSQTNGISRATLQFAMTEHAGVVRDAEGLDAVRGALDEARPTESVEDSALTTVASALVLAASQRRESRGCHTRADHPAQSDEMRRSIHIRRGDDGTLVSDCAATYLTGVS